ncbi:hypothetical protein [Paraburkholderia sp. RAU2J]|nr:hypothetical protein [Paraburkholderia sp. RAU2J]
MSSKLIFKKGRDAVVIEFGFAWAFIVSSGCPLLGPIAFRRRRL